MSDGSLSLVGMPQSSLTNKTRQMFHKSLDGAIEYYVFDATTQIPMMGEMMECAICGRKQKSDPKIYSGWRCGGLDRLAGFRLYYCPDHPEEEKLAHFAEFSDSIQDI